MPPVGAALAAIATAYTAAGVALGVPAFAMSAFANIAGGVALSAISRALQPKPQTGGSRGTKISITFGEDQPQSFILGTYATAGDLVYHGSWGKLDNGTPNIYYVQVIELCDLPARLKRLWINGQWITLLNEPEQKFGMGLPVKEFRAKGKDFMWVTYHDGTQTTADPYLLATFADDPDRPWTATMIGRGLAYLIVTSRFKPELIPGKPEVTAELEAWGHYDRRKDSSAGGSGPQRWSNWRTWTPSSNPIVLADNILRGIKDPITGEIIYGGPGIQNRRLSASMEFAAMNACDVLVPRGTHGATEPAYRAGLEVHMDEEPASIIEELLKACQGEIAVASGQWLLRAGAPSLPVYAFTDADIEILNSSDRFEPFPALDGAYNEVTAVYPEPEIGYATKDAPARKNATYLAQDRDLRNVAELKYPAVPYRYQVQRLMAFALKDQRRFRRHTLVLPPEAARLSPLDEVAWSSARYGYIDKLFAIDLVEPLANGCVAISLRERDPTDYDWNGTDELDTPVGVVTPPSRPPQVADFEVLGAIIYDDNGNPRRPAIRLLTPLVDNVTGIRVRVFKPDLTQVNVDSMVSGPRDPVASGGVMALANRPAALAGRPAVYSVLTDLDGDAMIVGNGILPDSDYLVQILLEPVTTNRVWSELKPVHTPPVGLGLADFSDIVVGVIGDARDTADAAAQDVLDMQGRVAEVEATVSGLGSEVLANQLLITEALGSLDTGTLTELLGISTAAAINGWALDPRFLKWTAASLDDWEMTGTAYLSKTTAGIYPSSLLLNAPSGSSVGLVQVLGSSLVDPAELPGADFTAAYVVLGLRMRYLSGNMAGLRARVEWRATGTGVWTRGHAFGQQNAFGDIVAQWGWVANTGITQDRSIIWERPVAADAIRIFLAKSTTDTNAVQVRVEVFDVRAATAQEVSAYLANGIAQAKVDELKIEITGPGGAIAGLQTSIRAEFGAADASILSTQTALSNATMAIAGRVDVVEATFGGNNLVHNPNFADGTRPAGQAPNFWQAADWDADFTVISKTASSSPAVVNCPTAFMAVIPGDSTTRFARANSAPSAVKANDIVATSISMAATGTGPINFAMGVLVRFYRADGSTLTSIQHTVPITSTAWTVVSWEDIAPANAATFDIFVQRTGGGSPNNALFTQVEAKIVDSVALAHAETALVTAATADSAIASLTTKLEAQFGSVDAFVSETATAVATADLAASALVFRATAGGGDASIHIVAFDDKDGVGDAILLDADNIIAPGTLAVGSLVVTDLGHNMVPDDQIQSQHDWTGLDGGVGQWAVFPVSSNENPDSVGEVRWLPFLQNAPLAVAPTVFSGFFPVRPGQRLVLRYQVQRLLGTRLICRGLIRWHTKDQTVISSTTWGDDDTTVATLRTHREQVVVPPTARCARFGVQVMPGNDCLVRVFSPSAISNEDASVLITPDEAFFEQLKAETAWIGTAMIADLTVGRIKIMDGAVSSQAAAVRTTNLTLASDTWTTVVAAVITKEANVAVGINTDGVPLQSSIHHYTGSGTPIDAVGSLLWRVLKGGVVLWTAGGSISNAQLGPKPFGVDVSPSTGSTTYTLQVMDATQVIPGFVHQSKTQSAIIDQAALFVSQVVK